MQKLIILILILTLILGVFASCNSKRYLPIDDETGSSPSEGTTTEDNQGGTTTDVIAQDTLPDFEDETTKPGEVKYVTSYEVKKVGDQWYMIFDSYIANPADITYYPPEYLRVESIAELRNDILNHRLTLTQMNTIVANFTRDDIGIPIFNLDEIYLPNVEGDIITYDEGFLRYKYYWMNGKRYDIAYFMDVDDDDGVAYEEEIDLTIGFFLLTKDNFESQINANVNFNDTVRTIQSGIKTITLMIKKQANLNETSYSVSMYVVEGDQYYCYWIDGFDEIPDDETLLSYGIEKYEG